MIKQTEANFEALIESTQELIWAVGLDYRLTLLNSSLQQRFQDSYGVRLEVGSRIQDFLPPERAACWTPFYERAISEGPFRVEYEMLNGQTLELAFNPIVVDEKTTGISVFGKDITIRKKALDALREKEALRREAERLARSGSSSWDVDSDTTTWSEGLDSILGRDPGTPAPSHAERAKIYTPESWARLDAAVKHTLATGEPYDLELQVVRPDGSMRWTHARGNAVRNELGHVHQLIGTLQDITEQKAIEETQALLASIIESSADAIHAVDLDGTVTSWNYGAEVMFGYKAEEMIGKNIAILAPPGRSEEAREFLEFVAKGKSISPFDAVLRDKNGCDIDLSLSMSPIRNSSGVVVGVSAIARDISQRKQIELALQKAEKKYRDIFDGAMEGIYQTSFEGRPLTANLALARMLGYDSTEDYMAAVKNSAQ